MIKNTISAPRSVLVDQLLVDDVGVVVLAYGRSNKHGPLLESLAAAGVGPHRIVVVHNPDRPIDGWQPLGVPDGTLLAQDRNLGYAAAMNRGIRRLQELGCAAALLLTHDTRLEPDSVAALVDAANAEPDYGVLGLAIVGAGGPGISYGSYMRRDGVIAHITDKPAGGLVSDVPFVDGSAMFVRMAACGEDPLPERYFMYFEETALCADIRRRGWRVGVATHARASSVPGVRNRTLAFTYLYVRNGLDLTLRYGGGRVAIRFAAQELGRAWQDLPKPGGRQFRRPAIRRAGLQRVKARLLGLIDFARGRWGPPPAQLLRTSDVRNT